MSFSNFGLKDKAKLDGMIEYLSRNLGVEHHKVRDIFTDYPIFNPFADFIKGNVHPFDLGLNERAHELIKLTPLPSVKKYIQQYKLELSINEITGLNRNNVIFAYNAILIQTPSFKDIYNDALYYGIIGSDKGYYSKILNSSLIPFGQGEFSRIELVNKQIYNKVCDILNHEEQKHLDNFWNPSEINLASLFGANIKDECHNPI